MIAIKLAAVVVDEPIVPTGAHARAHCQPTRLEVGAWGVDAIVYLPGLALVVVTYMDQTTAIVPVEHVWHMSGWAGATVLELLSQVMA